MDDKIRNSAAGRDAATHDAGNDPAAPRDRASARPGPALTLEELRNTLAAIDPVKEPARHKYLSDLLKVREDPFIEACAEHLLPLEAGRCPKCRDANGKPFVLDMQSKVMMLRSANPATAPATRLPDPGPDAEPVSVCAWCPSLHILKMARREQDIVVIYWQGKELRILRNGVSLKISHAICQPCRERMR